VGPFIVVSARVVEAALVTRDEAIRSPGLVETIR
jgi:hypothetical protein